MTHAVIPIQLGFKTKTNSFPYIFFCSNSYDIEDAVAKLIFCIENEIHNLISFYEVLFYD